MTTTAQTERDTIRQLARRVAELAGGQKNRRIMQRWKDCNARRPVDRAPVWCRPVGCWSELLPAEAFVCQDPTLRRIEGTFRSILIKDDIGDDSIVPGTFDVPAVFDVDPANRYGVDVRRQRPDDAGGAWAYDPPLKSDADFEKLRLPTFTYDAAETRRRLDAAETLLGDILPVRRTCGAPGTATLGNPAAYLRGLTEMMLDCAAAPARMHRLMAYVRDWTLTAMDQVASAGLLTPNNTGPMTCSDPVGPARPGGRVGYENLWVHANSQEFDQVSPAMWEEFCLAYQLPIIERFGASYYGCCENLTHKIDPVLAIGNLRMFTCSAWTDLDVVRAKCGRDYVIMWRQKASDVVFPDDVATIRRDLQNGARSLRGHHYQIVLRELQTLVGHMDRLHVWTAEAKDAAARWA